MATFPRGFARGVCAFALVAALLPGFDAARANPAATRFTRRPDDAEMTAMLQSQRMTSLFGLPT